MTSQAQLALLERVKELNCLYTIGRITDQPSLDLEGMLQQIAACVPPAWQYPEITVAVIELDGKRYATGNPTPTPWVQEARIGAKCNRKGKVQVIYLQERLPCDEGPFLKEERNLIDAIAQRIEEICDRKHAEHRLIQYQEQLRSLALQITRTEERERRRLAARVHDEIGHTLATARINLALAQKHAALPPEVTQLLDRTNALVLQAIRETRNIISDMSPPVLTELGLRRAVEWAVEQISESTGLTIQTDIAVEDGIVEEEVEAAFFHACRELLTNISKHAQTRSARLSLKAVKDTLSLEVEDPGVGFDVDDRDRILRESHFGIFNIKERIAQLGGALHLHSIPGKGTRVRVDYPLHPLKSGEGA